MKYFFLTDGWQIGRVWEPQGLWDVQAWRRSPVITHTCLYILEGSEKLWLYQVEEIVVMVEVKPSHPNPESTIGQVTLKRLMSAEDVLTYLSTNPSITAIQIDKTYPSSGLQR
ncbi:hypothetical protein L5470_12620 [Synechococcus sp. PCC 6717]|uniref:Uncharacterized protein n=1 Tax=Parathermosynechococcus lividus PCC 6715 TaxID=1917166 RepID=A0A2D2Q244_PARLV|nr:hypothetical protein [Thermostichus lividus]ATS18568.1 hypothetical protein BRW62_07145 [Thermostichus lividus PCC 6715]MCI3281802.1 hypothetical protein [Synechococcus sp. PCC 6717]